MLSGAVKPSFHSSRAAWKTALYQSLEERPFRAALRRLFDGGLSPRGILQLSHEALDANRAADPETVYLLYGQGARVNRAPSIQIVCPLMNDAPGLARKTTTGAISAVVPTRPSGVSFDQVPA